MVWMVVRKPSISTLEHGIFWVAEARYLKEGSIRNVGGKAVYDTLKSKTDLLVFQLGVAFRF